MICYKKKKQKNIKTFIINMYVSHKYIFTLQLLLYYITVVALFTIYIRFYIDHYIKFSF